MPEDIELGAAQTLLPSEDLVDDGAAELEEAFIDPEGDPEGESGTLPSRPMAFGRGWQFDISEVDFVRYGTMPAQISGIEELEQWIEFVLQIEAGAHSIFPDWFGMDNPFGMLGQPYSPALESEYERDAQQALGVHDRIASVDGFVFEHDEEEYILNVGFTVTTDTGEEILIEPPFEVQTNA